ncbi:MAG: response regulator transcription factor [Alphaproteobacteria bacterium]|nr:response regulator transcription factor [Alphaproteobacteria bacterium]
MITKPHILVVDDEPDIREPVAAYLEMNGYSACMAADSASALAAVRTKKPDLAILDIMLGKDDGIQLCKTLQSQAEIPVIFLSGRTEETERIIGLEVGADDYVTKPFNPRELLARVKAVLRRSSGRPAQSRRGTAKVRFGPWTFSAASHEIIHEDGRTVELSTGEAKLLQALIDNPHTVLNRDQLMDITQGRQADVFDRSIDNGIARLRKKVEENPRSPKLIKTYWGGGYALVCDIEQA